MQTGKLSALFASTRAGAIASLGLSPRAQTAPLTNSVTASSLTAYTINEQPNPTLTLQRGVTYVFQVNVSSHPFCIKTNLTSGTVDQWTEGVTGTQGMMQSTGAADWAAIPKLNSNRVAKTWATGPDFTNSFVNNTNTTGFDRQPLDVICGANVFFRVRNQSN